MDFWLILGFVGQFIFGMRFLFQWICSEKKKVARPAPGEKRVRRVSQTASWRTHSCFGEQTTASHGHA